MTQQNFRQKLAGQLTGLFLAATAAGLGTALPVLAQETGVDTSAAQPQEDVVVRDPALAAELEEFIKRVINEGDDFYYYDQFTAFAQAHPEFAGDTIEGIVRIMKSSESIGDWDTQIHTMADIAVLYPEHARRVNEVALEAYGTALSFLDSENRRLKQQALGIVSAVLWRLPAFRDDALPRVAAFYLAEAALVDEYGDRTGVVDEPARILAGLARDNIVSDDEIIDLIEPGLASDKPQVVGAVARVVGSNAEDEASARRALALLKPLLLEKHQALYDRNDSYCGALGEVIDAVGFIGNGSEWAPASLEMSKGAIDLLTEFVLLPDNECDHAAAWDISTIGYQGGPALDHAVKRLQEIALVPGLALMAARQIEDIQHMNGADLRAEAVAILKPLTLGNDETAVSAGLELLRNHARNEAEAGEVFDIVVAMAERDTALLLSYSYYYKIDLLRGISDLSVRYPQYIGQTIDMIKPLARQYADDMDGERLESIGRRIAELQKVQEEYLAIQPQLPAPGGGFAPVPAP